MRTKIEQEGESVDLLAQAEDHVRKALRLARDTKEGVAAYLLKMALDELLAAQERHERDEGSAPLPDV